MTSAQQIKALLMSHINGDEAHFFSVAMQVAASEARKGHSHVAKEIRDMIDEARSQSHSSTTDKRPVPINQPRGELGDLLDVSYPKIHLSSMTLSIGIEAQLKRVIKEQRNLDRIQSYGLSTRRKLLLVGPPGCGKTMSASALAGELGLPLFTVRLDGLITKYMGETTAKLRLIFNALFQTRGIYFFDEFDSIGSDRAYDNEVGEIRRVLNSFLIYIERDNSNSLIIAATNHLKRLDAALFRRFDDLIRFELPDEKLIINALKNRLSLHKKIYEIDYNMIAQAAKGLNFDDITRASNEALKDMIIQDRKTLSSDDILFHIKERVRLLERD
jgi:SpoVK/Ycf46/Vps4 family AAA+-type ATPase